MTKRGTTSRRSGRTFGEPLFLSFADGQCLSIPLYPALAGKLRRCSGRRTWSDKVNADNVRVVPAVSVQPLEKQAYQLPTLSRRMVKVLHLPVTGRCRTIFTSPILERRSLPLSSKEKPLCGKVKLSWRQTHEIAGYRPFAGLHAAKESSKRQIDACTHPATPESDTFGSFRLSVFTPNEVDRVISAYRLPILLPNRFTHLQRLVVEPTTNLQSVFCELVRCAAVG